MSRNNESIGLGSCFFLLTELRTKQELDRETKSIELEQKLEQDVQTAWNKNYN